MHTRIYIYRSNLKMILKLFFTNAQALRLFLVPSLHAYRLNFEWLLSGLYFPMRQLKNIVSSRP